MSANATCSLKNRIVINSVSYFSMTNVLGMNPGRLSTLYCRFVCCNFNDLFPPKIFILQLTFFNWTFLIFVFNITNIYIFIYYVWLFAIILQLQLNNVKKTVFSNALWCLYAGVVRKRHDNVMTAKNIVQIFEFIKEKKRKRKCIVVLLSIKTIYSI